MNRKQLFDYILVILLTLTGSYYLYHYHAFGWIAHDEGAIGHMAQRVLAGEVPHRDYVDLYTGAYSYLAAGIFSLFGYQDLRLLRVLLWLLFSFSIPILYYVTRTFSGPLISAATTLGCLVWSLPNHFGNHINWYVCFFSLSTLALLFRFFTSQTLAWLFLAGLMSGISLTFKILGLYTVASVLLSLLYFEQEHSLRQEGNHPPRLHRLYACFLVTSLFFLNLAAAIFFGPLAHPSSFVLFMGPLLSVSSVLIFREFTASYLEPLTRLVFLTKLSLVFLAGFLVPMAVLLGHFARKEALEDLFSGVFVRPLLRFDHATYELPDLTLYFGILIFILSSVLVLKKFVPHNISLARLTATALSVVFFLSLTQETLRALTIMLWLVVPPTLIIGSSIFMNLTFLAGRKSSHFFSLLCFSCFGLYILFPYSNLYYLWYTMPLSLIMTSAVLKQLKVEICEALMFFMIAFGVLFLPSGVLGTGFRTPLRDSNGSLSRFGASLVLPEKDTRLYSTLVKTIAEHSQGKAIIAFPDAPEVYFLSKKKNPLPVFYDFFAPEDFFKEKLPETSNGVSLIVINHQPVASRPIDPQTYEWIRTNFQNEMLLEHFEVRWRNN